MHDDLVVENPGAAAIATITKVSTRASFSP
jgi:hypothetical protein